MPTSKKKILVFCDHYLPGFKAGGGMWTVVNLVERFADRYDFYIVTRNHDGRNDLTPYKEVMTGQWNDVGPAEVLYLPPDEITKKKAASVVREIEPDLLILNSTFSKPALAVLQVRRSDLIGNIPLVLFATGELSKPALALNPWKKWAFLRYAKLTGLHRGVIWKASFEQERDEIREAISPDAKILIAPDLPPKSILPDFDQSQKPEKVSGKVRFIFVSRIARKKNLHFFIDRLKGVVGDIEFAIVGPEEDPEYWRGCEAAIKELPSNIKIEVIGPLTNSQTLERMCGAHFFVLPTLSENFGYVFIEALAAGCPLLISDRTVWTDVERRKSGWTIPLENKGAWTAAIETCVAMTQSEYDTMSKNARAYADEWLADPSIEKATERVIETALDLT